MVSDYMYDYLTCTSNQAALRPCVMVTAGRRPHAASARARVAVPALAAGLLLVPHEDAYQCVRTCPGARGWGEAWVAGALPSSCAEMAAQVVVVCIPKCILDSFGIRVKYMQNVKIHVFS